MKDQNTLTFFQALEVSASPPNGQALKRLALPKSIPMPQPSCTSTGQPLRTTAMCEQSQLFDVSLLPAGSRASRFPVPGSEEARMMTVTSGRQCWTLSNAANRLGCLVKTLLASSTWNSTVVLLIWKTRVTKSNRLLFQLAGLMPDTDESESGLWATPQSRDHFPAHSEEYVAAKKAEGHGMRNLNDEVRLWPTPDANPNGGDNFRCVNHPRGVKLKTAVKLWPTPNVPNGGRTMKPEDIINKGKTDKGKRQVGLENAVRMFPTASANDWKGSANEGQRRGQLTDPAMGVIPASGQLNPAWVEWLMGYPIGWTDLKDSAIQSSRKSPIKSSKQSVS